MRLTAWVLKLRLVLQQTKSTRNQRHVCHPISSANVLPFYGGLRKPYVNPTIFFRGMPSGIGKKTPYRLVER